MCSPSLGESAEPAFKRRKTKKHFTAFTLCNLFALRETPDLHAKRTHIISVIYPPSKDETETNKNKTNNHNTIFLILNHRIHILMYHPKGMGPPPLRNVSGGLIQSSSEPPCDLQPCASPPKIFLDNQRIPGTQKLHQTLKMILFPNSPVTANLSL